VGLHVDDDIDMTQPH